MKTNQFQMILSVFALNRHNFIVLNLEKHATNISMLAFKWSPNTLSVAASKKCIPKIDLYSVFGLWSRGAMPILWASSLAHRAYGLYRYAHTQQHLFPPSKWAEHENGFWLNWTWCNHRNSNVHAHSTHFREIWPSISWGLVNYSEFEFN